jgi:hypothetical protein
MGTVLQCTATAFDDIGDMLCLPIYLPAFMHEGRLARAEHIVLINVFVEVAG